MGRKLRGLLGALKDTAAAVKAAASPTDIAVLRATPRHPAASPPSPASLSALLSFGRSSRVSAAALVRSLLSRLSSTADPSVALKCLLCLHHLLSAAPFILSDALSSSLAPSSGRRSPLHLSSFRSPASLPLSSFVRWYARLLELLFSLKSSSLGDGDDDEAVADRLTSLLNKQLIAELDALTGVLEEIDRAPHVPALEDNGLAVEIMRRAEAERVNTQQAVLVRVREMSERLTELEFADSVELACLFRRWEERSSRWKDWELFWREGREVRERAEEEGRGGRVRRGEKISESARIGAGRVGPDESLRFGSSRGFDCFR